MNQTDKPVANGKEKTEKILIATASPPEKIELHIDKDALKKLKLVVVAYSHVERNWFPTDEAYEAEKEVEERAAEVVERIKALGIETKGQPGNQYFLTNLLVDKPDLVVNLVDTLKGKDRLQTSVPAALELSGFTYTGAEIEGLVIGNNRNITKHLLLSYDIPTPKFQFIRRAGTLVQEDFPYPAIVKLNESGGSVGIDNHAVKENAKDAQKRSDELLITYKMPVVMEQFIDGPEITVAVFDDGQKNHVVMAEKIFGKKPDGKYAFTSLESYRDAYAYKYKRVSDEALRGKIEKLAVRAFNGLLFRDYAKFDIRVDPSTNTPYFTDANPNTAFGPDKWLPFTEVLNLYGISFDDALASLLSKYAKYL